MQAQSRPNLWWMAAGVVVATLVAVLWVFPDASTRLRRASAPYAAMDDTCSLVDGPCTAVFDDGVQVTLSATPGEAVSTQPVRLRVEVQGKATPLLVELSGADMNMGLLRLPLKHHEAGFETTLVMPVCTTQRMKWQVDVVLDGRAAGFSMWSRM